MNVISPKNSHWITVDIGIGCDEREAVVDGVGNEDPVERVPVNPWEVSEEAHCWIVKVMTDRAKGGFRIGDELRRRNLEWELSQAVLDLDFQNGNLVEDDLVC
jgi:hypothetical protein